MNSELLTPNSELSYDFAGEAVPTHDLLSQVEASSKRSFSGGEVSGISSYLAGWMAGRGIDASCWMGRMV